MKRKYLIINLVAYLVCLISSIMLGYTHKPLWIIGLAVSAFLFGEVAKVADSK